MANLSLSWDAVEETLLSAIGFGTDRLKVGHSMMFPLNDEGLS